MSRARTYPVPGDPEPPEVEKRVPSKQQILTVLDAGAHAVSSKPSALVTLAKLFGTPPDGRVNESWARTVIDYSGTERLFDRMVEDKQIVGKKVWQWRDEGVPLPAASPLAMYYASAQRAEDLRKRFHAAHESQLWEGAATVADEKLRDAHQEEWGTLLKEAYEELRRQSPS